MFTLLRSRKLTMVLVAVIAALTAAVFVVHAKSDDLPEDAAFRLDDTVVTSDQVDDRMKALQALYGVERPTAARKADSFRRDTAKSMAVELLLKDAAEHRDIVVAGKAVDDALTSLVEQRYPEGGRGEFVRALGEMGASEKQVLDEIEQQLLIARLFDDVTRDVSVTDEELEVAFQDRRESLATPQQRTLRNIVVARKSEAFRLLRDLNAGVPFSTLARRASLDASTRAKGGLLGTVTADDLAPRYATLAFSANAGEPFGPVRTKFGWNVGLVQQTVPAEAAQFNKVAKALRETLLAEKSVTVWKDWLADLIRKADVEYADDFRPADPDGVPDMGDASEIGG